MTPDAFLSSLADPAPLPSLGAPLQALWWIGRGDWERAHGLVQDDPGPDAAWVHAHLHRREGDHGNAGYWYRRAGRPASPASIDAEWLAMVAELLARENA